MFNPSFYETIKNHNQVINTINCMLLELEKDISYYIENDPAVILYSYDPLTAEDEHYFKFDYPNIIFSLSPFKAVISYKEIISKLNDTINSTVIEQIVTKLILDHIN